MKNRLRQAAGVVLLLLFWTASAQAQSADLSVTKVNSPDQVIAGSNLTYTITVTNNGPSDAANASLSDPIPASTTFVSLTFPVGWSATTPPFGGTGAVSATRPAFAAGASGVFTIVVNVNAATPNGSTISNTATATSTTADPNPADNSYTAATTVQSRADLSVTKTDSPDPVIAGSNLTYTITVSNAGPSEASGVSLSDPIPANTTFVSAAQTSGPAHALAFNGSAVTATRAAFSAGATATFVMVVNVNGSTPAGGTITNTASVSTTTTDPTPANNSETETTSVQTRADLTVTKTDSPDPVFAGSNLTYTITVTNGGPSNATNATLSDLIPANTTAVSFSQTSGPLHSLAFSGTAFAASVTTFPAGASATFAMIIRVNAGTPNGATISNTATVSTTTTDPTTTNNSDTETTTVQRSSDLTVTKTDSPDPVAVGSNITYTITVSNLGPSDAANVTLTDPIPSSTTFASFAQTAGPAFILTSPPVGGTGTAIATLGSMAAGASAVFQLRVNVNATTFFGTTISNTATVSSASADPNPANSADTETTATTGGVVSPDLSVTKTDSPDPVLAGTNLTYTVTVVNNGPSAAQTVTLSDTVPANTTFVSLTAPAGWSVATPPVGGTGAITATRPTLPIGAPQVFTLVVNVNAATPHFTTLVNTATATTTGDPVSGNNADTETTTAVTVFLTSRYPTSGTTLGGTTVALDGAGFEPGVTVTFGGVPAAALKVLDATRLLAIAPPPGGALHASGPAEIDDTVPITVSDATGSVTLASGYTYLEQPPAESTSDLDGDGLSDLFEMRYSLDPSAASDASLDPDADGRTNLQEFQAGTHPRGFFTRYFAEGATGAFFDVAIALANADTFPAAVLLRFLKADGTTAARDVTVASLSRATLDAESVAGLSVAEFSTVIESDIQVVADRTMTWGGGRYGSHAETSIPSPSTTWFLAEGATHSGFDLFYLIQNANGVPADVTVTYLLPAPAAPIVQTYTVPENTRFNIWVDLEPGLDETDVSAMITADVPVIVERAMYLNSGGLLFGAGHESAGVTATATNWFLAEGATGTFFDLFILIANPNGVAAEVTATYLLPDGTTVVRPYVVAPNSRFNIWVDFEGGPLADTAVSATITATNGVGILVERAMWWPTEPAQWFEAHNSFGTTATGTRWALAEGEVGGANATETYILIANTSHFAGSATVTLLFEDGTTTAESFTLPANSRVNVAVAVDIPEANGRRFGAIVESTGGPPAQIVVERAMYSNSGETIWAAGTNAVATRLQ
jgi:uncharacterized repeat protein (TIGR01451 family)